jgi:hypothetical protein
VNSNALHSSHCGGPAHRLLQALAIRTRPEQCRDWLRQSGFELVIPEVSLLPYHYGIVAKKPPSQR